jgi:hypothetical protein
MTKEQIVDDIDDALSREIPPNIREKILDAVWDVLNDHMADPDEEGVTHWTNP